MGSPEKEGGRAATPGQTRKHNTADLLLDKTSFGKSDPRLETCLWQQEVEQSFVSTLWHHPEFIDVALLSIDPETHILNPVLRTVLEMICVVFWETGITDWALVLQALREIGAVEECGGLQGLNDVYTDNGHFPEGRKYPEPSVREYIRLLWYYQEQREQDPTKPVIRFSGGRGRLVPNRRAHRETDPSDLGEALIGGRRYRIAGWRDGDGLEIKFTPEVRR